MPMLKQMAKEKGMPNSFLLGILSRGDHADAKTYVTTKTKKEKK